MVNFEFQNGIKGGRSFVLMINEVEYMRARQTYKGVTYSRITSKFPLRKLYESDLTSSECFLANLKEDYEFKLLSCKGSLAYTLTFTKHILGCDLLYAQKKAIVILGVLNHYFLLRFECTTHATKDATKNIQKTEICLRLTDIYELLNSIGKKIQNKKLPTSSEFGLCAVCYKKSTRTSKICTSVYCSKKCQKVDTQINNASGNYA